MKRSRGRGRRGGGNPNRAHESTGPDVKLRGAASTIYEKYLQLARDASSSGDRVKAENYLQHAEHYFRIMAASQPRPAEGDNSGDDDDGDDGSDNDAQPDENRARRRRRPDRGGSNDGGSNSDANEDPVAADA